MGRRVYEDGNFVWKYVFGVQSSEQDRINKEFGIGEYEYEYDDYIDYLSLSINDIPALESILEEKNFDCKKKAFNNLSKKYEGVEVHFADNENQFEIKIVRPYEENKTIEEIIKEYDGDKYRYLFYSVSGDSPYLKKTKEFAKKYDYYFLEMVESFVNYMKDTFQKEGQDFFTFEGELM